MMEIQWILPVIVGGGAMTLLWGLLYCKPLPRDAKYYSHQLCRAAANEGLLVGTKHIHNITKLSNGDEQYGDFKVIIQRPINLEFLAKEMEKK